MAHVYSLMILVGLFADVTVEPRGGKIDWSSNLQAGLVTAAEKERPVMVYFTADW